MDVEFNFFEENPQSVLDPVYDLILRYRGIRILVNCDTFEAMNGKIYKNKLKGFIIKITSFAFDYERIFQ